MTYGEVKYFAQINEVNEDKVMALAESIRTNGYVGCPILVYGEQLMTGSHRIAALKVLSESGENVDALEVAEDVTEIVDQALAAFEEENGYIPEVDFSNIGWLFAGTWVEQYKDEIIEW